MLPILKCSNCNHIGIDYKQQASGPHLGAYCSKCGGWIQWLPKEEPKFHFGKYTGLLISEATDLQYLKWALEKVKLSVRYRKAITDRISQLEYELK